MGGISVYVSSNTIYSSINKFTMISRDYEFNFIKISKEYTDLSKNLIIDTCYRPPSGGLDNFIIKLNEVYEDLEKLNYFQYGIGDFNIDMLKQDTDQEIRLFLSQQVSSAMLPLITIPTRVTPSSSTLIDNCFSNNFLTSHSSYVLVTDISDHFPVLICIARKEAKSVGQEILHRSFSNRNLTKFKNNCEQIDWKKIIHMNDTQEAYTALHSNINNQFIKCFPLRQKTNKYKNILA